MPGIRTWLPLTGKLLSREGGGRADPNSPIQFPPLLDLYLLATKDLPEDVRTLSSEGCNIVWLKVDWDLKQVYVEIEGPQEFIGWLNSVHQVVGRSEAKPLATTRKYDLLRSVNLPEMEE